MRTPRIHPPAPRGPPGADDAERPGARTVDTLARDQYTGQGEIIDGGAFLGGSTLALATGLRDNPSVANRAGRVDLYDMFVADHSCGSSSTVCRKARRPVRSTTAPSPMSRRWSPCTRVTSPRFRGPRHGRSRSLSSTSPRAGGNQRLPERAVLPAADSRRVDGDPAGLPLAAHAVDLDHDGAARRPRHLPGLDALGHRLLPLGTGRWRPVNCRPGCETSAPTARVPGVAGAALRTGRPRMDRAAMQSRRALPVVRPGRRGHRALRHHRGAGADVGRLLQIRAGPARPRLRATCRALVSASSPPSSSGPIPTAASARPATGKRTLSAWPGTT